MQLESNPLLTLQAGSSSEQISLAEARGSFQRNSNWWTVFATFDLPDFKPSALWISKKTGIQVEEIVEALEGLTTLGFLKKENGSFSPVKGKEFLNFDWDKKTKSEILDDHSIVSQQILNHMHPDTIVAYDHRFFAGNKEIIIDLLKDIQTAFDKAFNRGQKNVSANNAIYKISFTGVDVLQSSESQGAQ